MTVAFAAVLVAMGCANALKANQDDRGARVDGFAVADGRQKLSQKIIMKEDK